MSVLRRLLGQKRIFRSEAYWKQRYGKGRTSGFGSYGRLAEYKADVINALVAEYDLGSVIEFGSGDGNQAALFDFAGYTGVDVVPQVVKSARTQFSDRSGWSFRTVKEDSSIRDTHDLSMSLDVIYHLVEDEVFDKYMRRLCSSSRRFVLVYASDDERERHVEHVRHRKYSDWIAVNAPDLTEVRTWEHPYAAQESETNPRDTSAAFFRLYRKASP